MALKTNGFEGVNGGPLTATTSDDISGDAFSLHAAGSGGQLIFTTTDALYGTTCGQFTQSEAANQPVMVQMTDPVGSASFATRIFVRLTGYPSTLVAFPFQVRSTTDARICSLNMTSTGSLRIVNVDGSVLAVGSAVLSLNVWYRVEFWGSGLNSSSGALGAAFYEPADTTPIEQITASGVTLSGGLADRVRYGRMGAATLASWKFDEVALNVGTSTPIGPLAVVATPIPTPVTATTTVPTPTIGITADVTTTPAGVSLEAVVQTPNALSNLLVPVDTVPLTTAVNEPSIHLSRVVAAATVTATTVVQQLSANVQATVQPDTTGAAVTVPTPAVSSPTSVVVQPPTYARPARTHSPSVIVPGSLITVTPPVLARGVTIPTPTPRLGQLPRPAVLQLAMMVATPVVIIGRFTPEFSEWDGTTEVELTIEGVWNGLSVEPAGVVEVYRTTRG
jgi:hypothetical protein